MIDSLPLVSAGRRHRGLWKLAKRLLRVESDRFGPAVASVALALPVALVLRHTIDSTTIFLVAVAAATWSRGWQAGLLAAILATITLDYFFIPPLYSIDVNAADVPQLVVFVLCALAVNWASDSRRVAAERARRESERQLAALFEDAPIGIALIDAAGHAFKTNPKLRQMLGYSESEFRRLSFTRVIHPPGVESDWNLFTELTHGRHHSYQLEKRCVSRDGTMIWARVTVSLVRADNGNPLFGIALVAER